MRKKKEFHATCAIISQLIGSYAQSSDASVDVKIGKVGGTFILTYKNNYTVLQSHIDFGVLC